MKNIVLIFLVFIGFNAFAQRTNDKQINKTSDTNTAGASSFENYDDLIICGGVGAGAVVSTNIVNSGAVLPYSIDFLLRYGHQDLGIGITNEIYLTPENLVKLAFGNSSNTTKVYFMYELNLFKKTYFNIGLSGQIGGFFVGDERDSLESSKSRYFGNVGVLTEIGTKKVTFYIRPYLEYKSYDIGSLHKEILLVTNIGLRFKIPNTKWFF